jgi:hypothetical protein
MEGVDINKVKSSSVIRVKLSVLLIRDHAMKMFGVVKVQFHSY